MPNFINLPPFAKDGAVQVVIETPRGSRAKFAYNTKLEASAHKIPSRRFDLSPRLGLCSIDRPRRRSA